MKKYLLQFFAVALLLVAVSAKQAFALSVPTQLVSGSTSFATYRLGPYTAAAGSGQGGTLTAWGYNTYGQLGRGSYATADAIAVQVVTPIGANGWIWASAGYDFALGVAVTSTDSSVYAWGHNNYGQLGTTTNSGSDVPNPVPIKVTLPTTAKPKFVTAGYLSSYALTTDGNIYSWGINNYGQLGRTTNSGTSTPTPSPTVVSFTPYYGYDTLAAGFGHAIAIGTETVIGVPNKSGGSPHPDYTSINVYTFGQNLYGQLGTSTGSGTVTPYPSPTYVAVGGSGNPSSVAAGIYHSLVLLSDGSLKTFGSNQYGQLGYSTNSGTTVANPTPNYVAKPSGATGWKQIAAGGNHTAAIDSTGKLYTWGYNYYGQLGRSTNYGTNNANPTPTLVTLPNSATAASVSAGLDHTTVYGSDGNTYTFGYNYYGQLGNQTNIGTSVGSATALTVGNSTVSLPYSQSFESGWTSPADLSGWTSYSATTSTAPPDTNNAWQRDDYYTHWRYGNTGAYTPAGANSTTHSARFHSYGAYNGTTGSLVSPQFALTGTTTVSYYTINTDGSDTLFFALSTDGGSSFTNIDTATANASGWQLRNKVFSSTSSTVKFRFTAKSDYGNTDIGVDEFSVGAGVLPVELTAFDAKLQSGSTLLNWTTATEKNNAGFDIERSSDNQAFTKIGFVQGHGTTTQAQSYSFSDKATLIGKSVFYRLKQTDYDGKFEYSKTVEVKLNVPKVYALNQNYPNPFNPSTVISYQLPVSSQITLKVYDVLGREVQTLVNERKEAGTYSVTLDATRLASGVYLYKLQAGSFVQTKKMLLVK